MSSESTMKQFLLALCVVGVASSLTACGGSSSNVAPGKEVIPPPEVPPTDPNEPTTPPPGGGPGDVSTVIPDSLKSAIYNSGQTTPDGKPVYVIDVAKLPGGALDPAGLKLGNDVVFRIDGGAARITQN